MSDYEKIKQQLEEIHAILGEDLTDVEVINRIREVLYGKDEPEQGEVETE